MDADLFPARASGLRAVARSYWTKRCPRLPSCAARLQGWKSRRAHPGFSLAGVRLSVLDPASLREPQRLMDVFRYVATQGVKLSREAEDQIRETLPGAFQSAWDPTALWEQSARDPAGAVRSRSASRDA